MRAPNLRTEAGFTMVELIIVVVISTISLIAVYQTLITQERTYRYQSAAIDAQGSTRTALQVLSAELRELSASAGDVPANTGGSDLLMATRDSIRFRAFRKIGIVCNFSRALGTIDVWVPGDPFVTRDNLLVFQEGDSITDDDDRWASVTLAAVGSSPNEDACAGEWGAYDVQQLRGMLTVAPTVERGALVRSFEVLTYGIFTYDGDYVLGRMGSDGIVEPLVGPLLPPGQAGLRFRFFNANGVAVNPTTEALRATVARINIIVRGLSPGGIDGPYVDSLSTNVYLRGN